MNRASLITMIEGWERLPATLSRVPHRSTSSLQYDYRVDQRGTLIRAGNFSYENAVCIEAAKTISPLYYGGIAEHACQVVSLSLLSRIIYAHVWCTYMHTGWSSIVLNVQSADNVPGGQPTLPTNLAIVRATSRAFYIRFLGVWARFCRKSLDPEIS